MIEYVQHENSREDRGGEVTEECSDRFQQEGSTVEFPTRLDVRDPGACGSHTVRASESLEGELTNPIEHNLEKLEDPSVASQMRSAEGSGVQSSCERAGDANQSQRPLARSGKSIRVVISKQQLSKLLAEGSIKQSAGCRAVWPPGASQNTTVGNMAQLISNAMRVPGSPGSAWSPRLDTVAEVPAQLTRSPVISRQGKEVEHLLQTKI